MRLAIFQTESTLFEVEQNLEKLNGAALQAANNGADLLVCPELFLTGYCLDRNLRAYGLQQNDATITRICEISDSHNVGIVLGYAENAGADCLYNSACFVAPGQGVICNYRKTHLYLHGEQEFFAAGNEFQAVEFRDWKVGLLICYDVEFPEAVRQHAVSGVDLVVVPTALFTDQPFIAGHVVRTRALESHVFLAYVNHCGEAPGGNQYCGLSSVTGPDGIPLVEAKQEETILYADLNKDDFQSIYEMLPYLDDRRPSLYRAV